MNSNKTREDLSIYKHFSVNVLGREEDIVTFLLVRSKRERRNQKRCKWEKKRGGSNRE